jgi:hypothetical protein
MGNQKRGESQRSNPNSRQSLAILAFEQHLGWLDSLDRVANDQRFLAAGRPAGGIFSSMFSQADFGVNAN